MSSDQSQATTEARFSDGASAKATTVRVHLAGDALEIIEPGARLPRRWALGHVVAATALRASSQDVLLRPKSGATESASLFINDQPFIRALVAAAPHLTTRSQHLSIAKTLATAAVFVALLVGLGFYLGWSPARTVAGLLPDTWRQTMGDGAVRSITGTRRVCDRSEGQAALASLMTRLLGEEAGRYKVMIVDWGLVNAFAAPGERIVVTSGIVRAASGPDELASVIAHEIGHGQALDPETGIVRVLGLTALVELITGGSSGAIANLGLMLTQIGYTRAAEYRADQSAIRILRKAEIDPKGASEFFKRLAREDKSPTAKTSGPVPEFSIFSTHPPSGERAKLFESLEPYATRPALTADEWASLRRICDK
jgi:Zn-dependent protease with chaperone function